MLLYFVLCGSVIVLLLLAGQNVLPGGPTRLCSENANLRQGQNLKQRWSGIRIRISGLIWIGIRMSAGSFPKCCGFIHLPVSVISSSFVKIDRWLY